MYLKIEDEKNDLIKLQSLRKRILTLKTIKEKGVGVKLEIV
jgi:hypothetical protein